MPDSLLIRGGTVIDGTGAPRYDADVRLREGRIAEIGPNLAANGETTLDARTARKKARRTGLFLRRRQRCDVGGG